MSLTKHKKIFFLFTFLAIMLACKKYPDGPSLSVLTKKARLCGNWQLQKGFINGIERKDSVFNFEIYLLSITKKNTYSVSWLVGGVDYNEEGTWQWINNKALVNFKYTVTKNIYGGFSGGPKRPGEYNYEIRKLKNEELWVRQVKANGEIWDMHFIPRK